jgi:hypothetical protein
MVRYQVAQHYVVLEQPDLSAPTERGGSAPTASVGDVGSVGNRELYVSLLKVKYLTRL